MSDVEFELVGTIMFGSSLGYTMGMIAYLVVGGVLLVK